MSKIERKQIVSTKYSLRFWLQQKRITETNEKNKKDEE